jgi:hypothetical protein
MSDSCVAPPEHRGKMLLPQIASEKNMKRWLFIQWEWLPATTFMRKAARHLYPYKISVLKKVLHPPKAEIPNLIATFFLDTPGAFLYISLFISSTYTVYESLFF